MSHGFPSVGKNINSENDIERLRQQTDQKLMLYLKNYKELAFNSRGTQTTPPTNVRKSIFGNDLSIMCEMPKMTRTEATTSNKHHLTDLEKLKRRWDVSTLFIIYLSH